MRRISSPGCQRRLDLGRRPRLAMKLLDGNGALAAWTEHVDLGIEGDERDRPVAGIDGDAGLASAQQRMPAVDAVLRRAAAAGLALVAGEWLAAAEIGAAGALQQIAADGRHVAQLLRRRPPQRFRQRRIFRNEASIGRHVAHPRQGAEGQLSTIRRYRLR